MRLLLKLNARHADSLLPINYQYQLSSAIYKLLKFGSEEFAQFLHDRGYPLNGRAYKLFTFAMKFERFKIENDKIRLISPAAHLFVTSPLIDDFIKNFVIGTFEKQILEIISPLATTEFFIRQIETLPEPNFNDEMKFILLSPLVLSTKKEFNGALKQYYLRANDTADINRVLTNNLINKYAIVYNSKLKIDELNLTWDDTYLRTHPRTTKKITIDENGESPIDVIGLQAPFTITGDQRLIKLGYECGFGEKNSMGFGMADTDFTDFHGLNRKQNGIN